MRTYGPALFFWKVFPGVFPLLGRANHLTRVRYSNGATPNVSYGGTMERKPQLHVTTSPEQLAQIKQAAASEGLSVASYIRQAVLTRVNQEIAQKPA